MLVAGLATEGLQRATHGRARSAWMTWHRRSMSEHTSCRARAAAPYARATAFVFIGMCERMALKPPPVTNSQNSAS